MTEKRFENRLDKSNIKFNTLNPAWDNEKEDGLNVFEMIDLLNDYVEENEQLKQTISNYKENIDKVFNNIVFADKNAIQSLKKQLKEELEK